MLCFSISVLFLDYLPRVSALSYLVLNHSFLQTVGLLHLFCFLCLKCSPLFDVLFCFYLFVFVFCLWMVFFSFTRLTFVHPSDLSSLIRYWLPQTWYNLTWVPIISDNIFYRTHQSYNFTSIYDDLIVCLPLDYKLFPLPVSFFLFLLTFPCPLLFFMVFHSSYLSMVSSIL